MYIETAERLERLDTFLALLQRRISPLLRLPTPLYHPQALYVEAAERLDRLDTFLALLQRRISPLLRRGDLPPRAMIDAVAAAKV